MVHMRLHISEHYVNYVLSRTVFPLSHSIGLIIAFNKGVPLINAPVLGNLFEYRHKSYIAEN